MLNTFLSLAAAAGFIAGTPTQVQAQHPAATARLDRVRAAAVTGVASHATAQARFVELQRSFRGAGAVWAPERFATEPPAPASAQDPADSVYREARSALNRGSYTRAAYLFGQIRERHPRSTYAADSYYWEAFAHYRSGSAGSMNAAQALLREQAERAPNAATRRDADALATRIRGQLARQGDAQAAREMESMVSELAGSRAERERQAADRARASSEGARSRQSQSACRELDDERTAALNALMQMDSERALPILKRVMARRDEGSACLRRRAVFLISQHDGQDAEAMLLEAVRSDPDREVREQGVFWLSQVRSESAVAALDSVLRASTDQAIQEKAIFALSQHDSPRAQRALQDFARRASAPAALRENAIFWLGQSSRSGNAEFLQTLYASVREPALKEKIIFSLAQTGSAESARWLLRIASDESESTDTRKKAVFWAVQSGGVDLPELFALYDRARDRELKEQLIFAYSQSGRKPAVDKLIDIAKTESDKDLRKKALFWLSQTDDPRVAALIAEILEKP